MTKILNICLIFRDDVNQCDKHILSFVYDMSNELSVRGREEKYEY